MIVMDYNTGKEYSQDAFPALPMDKPALFVCCRPGDVPKFQQLLALDESTVLDCIDIDESVRFTSFDGYDFISLVHLDVTSERLVLNELNLYLSRDTFILVMPEQRNQGLAALESRIVGLARGYLSGKNPPPSLLDGFNQMLFVFFNTLVMDFNDSLELLEDRMQALSGEMTYRVDNDHFEKIHLLRDTAYSIKKVLRSFSYMGLQLLCNENDVLTKKKMFLFRNLDTRFRKLYDFAESVYGLSTELLGTYDSKITQRTNDVVNKLTAVTIFFGPLTVITGIYGMNFRQMPELETPWGYPISLAVMLVVSIGIFWFMKRNKWL